MARRDITEVIDQERVFGIDELFFSITNKAGIIQQGNSVFVRVSGYSYEEILGAPHNILRHPDMPRVVFKLMWDTIKAGETIAAYVKNRSKCGRYYWVLAVVMPTDGGYLSIRLKPTSSMLSTVINLYGQLLITERQLENEGRSRAEAMAASGKRLEKALAELGYSDYPSFMNAAISTEMTSRHRLLRSEHFRGCMRSPGFRGYELDDRTQIVAKHFSDLDNHLQNLFQYLDEFRETNVRLIETSHAMLANSATIRLLSLNATVAASQLGSKANTLSVVAESLGEASGSGERDIIKISEEMGELVDSLSALIFEVATIKLQSEVSNFFLNELQRDGVGSSHGESQSLSTLVIEVNKRISTVYERLSSTESAFAILRKRVERLLLITQRLRFVQFAGLKESVALSGADAFAVIFDKAKSQIDETRRECDKLAKLVENCQSLIRSIRGARGDVISLATSMMNWTQSLPGYETR